MTDIKMSELLSLPVKREPGGVMPYLTDANGEVIFVGDGYHIDAIVIAVNIHDTLVAKNLALKAVLEKVLEISGGSNEQNMANFDDELASQHNDDINEIYKLVKALKGVGDDES